VLQRADPALVDPGVTAQMERLLDDVLVGRQDMMSAIDAVCDQASRIIGRLTQQGASEVIPTTLATNAAAKRFRQASSARRSGSAQSKAPTRRRPTKPALSPDAARFATARAAAKQGRPTASFAADATKPDAKRTQAGLKGRASSTRGNQTSPNGGQSNRPITNSSGDVSGGDTPLRIPYGNKETAQALGARYRADGWYAPADVSLTTFRERGWL